MNPRQAPKQPPPMKIPTLSDVYRTITKNTTENATYLELIYDQIVDLQSKNKQKDARIAELESLLNKMNIEPLTTQDLPIPQEE